MDALGQTMTLERVSAVLSWREEGVKGTIHSLGLRALSWTWFLLETRHGALEPRRRYEESHQSLRPRDPREEPTSWAMP